MTRKRFVKLLMSHGYSRNSANEIAWNAYYKDWSYEKYYRYMKTTYLIHEIDWKMRKSIRLAMKKLKRMANDVESRIKLDYELSLGSPNHSLDAYSSSTYITKT